MASYLSNLEQLPADQRWPQLARWMKSEPLPLYRELREYRPILELPELLFVTRLEDCIAVLRQPNVFTVALYKPKQGDYWMAQDETARHWREKSIMRSVLDFEQLAELRQFVGARAAAALQGAAGSIDIVDGLSRAVPIALVQDRFGFRNSDPAELRSWSYWNQYDAFHNQPFDAFRVADPAQITTNRQAANARMVAYLAPLVQRRLVELMAGAPAVDPVARLLKLSLSGGVQLDFARVVQNVGGLLIGTVETTSHAVVNALEELLRRPEILPAAQAAARADDPAAFDGYVWEALRFHPPFPYFFRVCEQPARLAGGSDHATTVAVGKTVLTCVHSAMFDERVIANPDRFDPTRTEANSFHFGYGHHECLGRHIGRQIIPEIVRQVLRLDQVAAVGPVDHRNGPFPEAFQVQWTVS